MTTHVLGGTVNHDVGTMLNGTTQVGAWHSVVNDQGHAVGMRDLGQPTDVGDVAQGIADGLAIDRLGLVVDQLGKVIRLAVVGKTHLNAELRQGVGKQVVGAAVQGRGRHNVVAGFGDGLDGVGDRRLTRRYGQGRNAALERSDPLFQHVLGRVHDPGIDVAQNLQVKQVCTMLGVVKGIGHRLINRGSDGPCRGVPLVAGMNGLGLKLPIGVVCCHG